MKVFFFRKHVRFVFGKFFDKISKNPFFTRFTQFFGFEKFFARFSEDRTDAFSNNDEDFLFPSPSVK